MSTKSSKEKRSESINKDEQNKKSDVYKKPITNLQSQNNDVDNILDDLGYINGYNIKKNQNFDPNNPSSEINITDKSKSLEPFQPTSAKTPGNGNVGNIPNRKSSEFPIPIKNFNFYESALDFEDPTFLTFDIFLYTDRSSALFDQQTPYGVYTFLKRNESISQDFEQRIQILDEFKDRIEKLFYSLDDDSLNQNKKTHYIQSIEGIENFKKPIIKYKEDKIKITLVEDVKMTAEYVAELYNNLSYDYKFKRKAIPENCLRFDMAVMISDIRRFKKETPNFSSNGFIVEEENRNISREIFILRDCNFDFTKSFNIENSLTQGGIGTSNPDTSNLSFEIYYKSAERALFADLFDQGNQGRNMRLLTHKIINDEANLIYNKSGTNFYANKHLKKGIKRYENSKPSEKINRNNEGDDDSLSDRLLKTVSDTTKKHINQFTNQALSVVRQKKGKLLESFRQELTDELQIESISPDNVYETNFNEITLENFVKGLRGELYNNISSEILGEISREGDDAIDQAQGLLNI